MSKKLTYDEMISLGVPQVVAEASFTIDHHADVTLEDDGTVTVSDWYDTYKFDSVEDFVADAKYTEEQWEKEAYEAYEAEAEEAEDSIGCKDCPDDECTGHCFSCAYRPL